MMTSVTQTVVRTVSITNVNEAPISSVRLLSLFAGVCGGEGVIVCSEPIKKLSLKIFFG